MSAIQYRPAIDGMRSIAVVSVLLFHLDKKILPGGFVGVDIFFVISGYLITSIINAEGQSGRFSLVRFYQRRISRIFPVFFTVVLCILLAASVLYTSQDFASAGALATASVLSVANMKLMLQGNYFELSPDAQPFLHFWSLSVEEQFYFVVPFTLAVAYKLRCPRKLLLAVLWLMTLASFAGCVVLTSSKPTWAFYLLPTRAWELLAGSLLAISSSSERHQRDNSNCRWLSVAGLLLIVLSLVVVSENKSFPGYIALLPVLGTVLLIGFSHDARQFTEVLLSQPLLVLIGRVSYSLYLWHWPVYCFVDYALFEQSFAVRTVLKVSLTVLLSTISFTCIENPTRSYLNKPSRSWLAFAGLVIGVTAFGVAGTRIRALNYIDSSVADVANGGIEFKVSSDSPSIVLMGDSNGSMYGLLIKDISAEAQINANVISVAAGDPFPPNRLYAASMQYLASRKPAITLFVAAWNEKIGQDKTPLQTALAEILSHSSHVILITQPPMLPQSGTREFFRNHGPTALFEDTAYAAERIATNAYLKSLENSRIHVLDIESLFVDQSGQIRFRDSSGKQLFHDRTHLSGYGADQVRQSLLKQIRRLSTEKDESPDNASLGLSGDEVKRQ